MRTTNWPNLTKKEESLITSQLMQDYFLTRKESKKILSKIYLFAICIMYLNLFGLMYFEGKQNGWW
jgi:hypothetical protein